MTDRNVEITGAPQAQMYTNQLRNNGGWLKIEDLLVPMFITYTMKNTKNACIETLTKHQIGKQGMIE